MKANQRRLLRRIMTILPYPLRHRILRKAIEVPGELPDQDFEFKIAETQDELEKAYGILHDSFVEFGFSQPHPSGLRIVKYFALPTTTTLIAKFKGEVVATLSIIRKGPFGLPLEQVFDLTPLEANGRVVAEVSSLAIAQNFRKRRGALLLPLCKFFYLYIKYYMKLDRVVIAVNPNWADFYEGFLDFSKIPGGVVGKYDFANGAAAVGLWSDVTTWEDRFIQLYSHNDLKHNFYKYFVIDNLSCIKFPERTFKKAFDAVMTPKMLDYFFNQRSKVFSQLSFSEILALRSCYPYPAYQDILPKLSDITPRTTSRFIVHADARLNSGEKIRVIDVSSKGILLQGNLPTKTKFDLKIQVTKKESAVISVQVIWIDYSSNRFGAAILESDSTWVNYIENLETEFERIAG